MNASGPIVAPSPLKEAPVLRIGAGLAFISVLGPMVNPLFFICSVAFLVAAFVIAIVGLVKGRMSGGIGLILAVVMASGLAFVGTLMSTTKAIESASRTAAKAESADSHKAVVRPAAALQRAMPRAAPVRSTARPHSEDIEDAMQAAELKETVQLAGIELELQNWQPTGKPEDADRRAALMAERDRLRARRD